MEPRRHTDAHTPPEHVLAPRHMPSSSKRFKVLGGLESLPPFKIWHQMASWLRAQWGRDQGTLGSLGAGVGAAGSTSSRGTLVTL